MTTAKELAWLFRELTTAASPLQRMRLLSRAWRSLRTLSAYERNLLASRVGIDGAEELIEKLAAGKAGISPAALQRVLDRVRDADPESLAKALKDLRDPEGRSRLLGRGLDALTATPGGDDDTDDGEPAEGFETKTVAPHPDKPTAADPAAPRARSVPVSAAATAAAGAAVAATRATRPRAEPSVPATRRSRPASGKERAPIAEPPTAATPAAVEPESAVIDPVKPAAGPPARKPVAIKAEVRDSSVGTGPDRPGLLRRLAEERVLTRRFRVLRSGLLEARELNAESLQGLLDCFPPGWARRRALDALLGAGIPAGLHQAVFLIEQLDSAIGRRWCAGTLLRVRDLSPEERLALVERYRGFGDRAAG